MGAALPGLFGSRWETPGKQQKKLERSYNSLSLSLSGSYIPSSISFQHENLNKTICSQELLKMHCKNWSLTKIWINVVFIVGGKKLQTECITLHTRITSHHFFISRKYFHNPSHSTNAFLYFPETDNLWTSSNTKKRSVESGHHDQIFRRPQIQFNCELSLREIQG